MTEDLTVALHERLDALDVPPGDVATVVRRGRRLRRRRQARTTITLVATLALAWFGATALIPTAGERAADGYARFDPFDVSQGLRAYADPGFAVHMGGQTFDATEVTYLDTDAAATPRGVLFYDHGRPMLMREDGEVVALVDGPVDAVPGFRPTAKIDSRSDEVAFAIVEDDEAVITVRDLATNEDVHEWRTPCEPCSAIRIDAYDDGVLYLRTGRSTVAVLLATGEVVDLGATTRIADVRNGVVLYNGPTPRPTTTREWTFVRGPVDAQLTFDGAHVLDWSSSLRPTDPSGQPLQLDVARTTDAGPAFWTMDTDGSVLVAAVDGRYPNFTVHDCELPSGSCTEVGPLRPRGGDPAFIGNDM